jgi:hypothetical protein
LIVHLNRDGSSSSQSLQKTTRIDYWERRGCRCKDAPDRQGVAPQFQLLADSTLAMFRRPQWHFARKGNATTRGWTIDRRDRLFNAFVSDTTMPSRHHPASVKSR